MEDPRALIGPVSYDAIHPADDEDILKDPPTELELKIAEIAIKRMLLDEQVDQMLKLAERWGLYDPKTVPGARAETLFGSVDYAADEDQWPA